MRLYINPPPPDFVKHLTIQIPLSVKFFKLKQSYHKQELTAEKKADLNA